jgi:hypothetical protein
MHQHATHHDRFFQNHIVALNHLLLSTLRKPPAAQGEQEVYITRTVLALYAPRQNKTPWTDSIKSIQGVINLSMHECFPALPIDQD